MLSNSACKQKGNQAKIPGGLHEQKRRFWPKPDTIPKPVESENKEMYSGTKMLSKLPRMRLGKLKP